MVAGAFRFDDDKEEELMLEACSCLSLKRGFGSDLHCSLPESETMSPGPLSLDEKEDERRCNAA